MIKPEAIGHFKELIKKGYSLDQVFLLNLLSKGYDIDEIALDSVKMGNIHVSLYRKGLVSMNKLTVEGEELLKFLSSDEEKPIIPKKKNKDEEFSKFWSVFPATDTFTYKGKSFQGSRSLRISKEDCKEKLKAILNEGEYTIDEIVGAIEIDILQKKEASLKQNTNKLTYLQNALTYLRQRSYEPFIDLYKEGHKVQESKKISGGVDV